MRDVGARTPAGSKSCAQFGAPRLPLFLPPCSLSRHVHDRSNICIHELSGSASGGASTSHTVQPRRRSFAAVAPSHACCISIAQTQLAHITTGPCTFEPAANHARGVWIHHSRTRLPLAKLDQRCARLKLNSHSVLSTDVACRYTRCVLYNTDAGNVSCVTWPVTCR